MIVCIPGQEANSFTISLNSSGVYENSSWEEIESEEMSELDHESMALTVILRKIGFIPIYVIIFMTGILGNSLVIAAILRLKRLQSVTNIFLLSLATSDFILIIICVPIKITEFITHNWLFGAVYCKLFHYMHFFSAICSVMNLTAMSLERYLAIMHPLKAKYTCTRKRAKMIVLFIWLLSLFAASPILIGKKLIIAGDSTEVCYRVWCDAPWRIFEIYRTSLLLVIPFGIMLITYSVICLELWEMPNSRRNLREDIYPASNIRMTSLKKEEKGGKAGQSRSLAESADVFQIRTSLNRSKKSNTTKQSTLKVNSNKLDDENTRKQIIKMLLCIVLIFFICWAPLTINFLLTSFRVLPNLNYSALWYLRIIFYAMSYFNSCVNPIVYAFMSKNFREGFKLAFASLCGKSSKDWEEEERLRFLKTYKESVHNNLSEVRSAEEEPRLSRFNSTQKTLCTEMTNADSRLITF